MNLQHVWLPLTLALIGVCTEKKRTGDKKIFGREVIESEIGFARLDNIAATKI